MEYKFKRLRENEFSIGDYILIAATIAIMVLGLITLRSVVWGTEQQGRFVKQIIWDLVSLVAMFYVIFEKEARIKRYGKYLLCCFSDIVRTCTILRKDSLRCKEVDRHRTV